MRIVLLILTAVLAGCASGPKYSEIKGSIPELNPEQGRIFFYRPGALGAAIQPNILLNGNVVGEMVPQGFFFVDRAPGTYMATARTESEASLEIQLPPNETRYVKGSISLGIFVGRPNLTPVDPRDAVIELDDLGYTGTVALRPGSAGAVAAAAAPPLSPASGGSAQLKDLEGLLKDQGVKQE